MATYEQRNWLAGHREYRPMPLPQVGTQFREKFCHPLDQRWRWTRWWVITRYTVKKVWFWDPEWDAGSNRFRCRRMTIYDYRKKKVTGLIQERKGRD